MPRNVLLITTDQQRYDALGCNGGKIAATPVIDGLARDGINYHQARDQCRGVHAGARHHPDRPAHPPARRDAPTASRCPPTIPSLAHVLNDAAGTATALDRQGAFRTACRAADSFENTAAGARILLGPHRGFDHMELAGHTGRAGTLAVPLPEMAGRKPTPTKSPGFHEYTGAKASRARCGGGDTGAPQVAHNPIDPSSTTTRTGPRGAASTGWPAREDGGELVLLDELPRPAPSLGRAGRGPQAVRLARPAAARRAIPAAARPARTSWPPSRMALAGRGTGARRQLNFEVPPDYVPADHHGGPDPRGERHRPCQERADRRGRRAGHGPILAERGWDAETDIFFTADHGELQGDFGMLFKGPVPRRRADQGAADLAPRPRRTATSPPPTCRTRSATSISPRPSSPPLGIDIPAVMQGAPLAADAGRRVRMNGSSPNGMTTYDGNEVVDALHGPRRLPGHRLRADQPATTAARASYTRWPTTRSNGATCGTTRPWRG